MKRISLADDLSASVDGDAVRLHGELHRDNAGALLQCLERMGPIAMLDMDDLDITDGIAATQAVNAIRHILAGQERLCLMGAPQLLAHNLYRSRLLENGRIILKEMREDEAYG